METPTQRGRGTRGENTAKALGGTGFFCVLSIRMRNKQGMPRGTQERTQQEHIGECTSCVSAKTWCRATFQKRGGETERGEGSYIHKMLEP